MLNTLSNVRLTYQITGPSDSRKISWGNNIWSSKTITKLWVGFQIYRWLLYKTISFFHLFHGPVTSPNDDFAEIFFTETDVTLQPRHGSHSCRNNMYWGNSHEEVQVHVQYPKTAVSLDLYTSLMEPQLKLCMQMGSSILLWKCTFAKVQIWNTCASAINYQVDSVIICIALHRKVCNKSKIISHIFKWRKFHSTVQFTQKPCTLICAPENRPFPLEYST